MRNKLTRPLVLEAIARILTAEDAYSSASADQGEPVQLRPAAGRDE